MKRETFLRPNTKSELALELEEKRGVAMISLQQTVTNFLLGLFALNTLSVLVMIFLRGFGKLELSDGLILTLIGETVAQSGAIFFTVVRKVFSR